MIPVSTPNLGALEREYLLDAYDSGWISGRGRYIERFEAMLAERFGVDPALVVSCSSGTAALHLALLAKDVRGGAVIVPALTYAATASVVKHVGAEPVFVDVDESWLIDWKTVYESIRPWTSAVIPVDLYGLQSCEEGLSSKIVIDACEALPLGPRGYTASFSFFPNKHLTTGEGGAVVARDHREADRIRLFREGGHEPGSGMYEHKVAGLNYRLTNLQAAIGCAQLERYEEIMADRKRCINGYKATGLKGRGEWVFVAETRQLDFAMELLTSAGIGFRRVFKPLPGQAPFPCETPLDFVNAWKAYRTGLILPVGPHVSDEEISRIGYLVKGTQ